VGKRAGFGAVPTIGLSTAAPWMVGTTRKSAPLPTLPLLL
jgi:hypothetical protein